MAFKHSPMVISIEATMKTVNLTAKDSTLGQMEPTTKVSFIKAWEKEKVLG